MSEDGSLFISLSTPNTPSEHLRDKQLIRSVFKHDEQLIRSVLEHDGSDEYAVFGCVRARGVILLFNSFTDMRPCAYARGAAGVR